MNNVSDIQRHIDLVALADKYSNWIEVPIKERVRILLTYSEEMEEFHEVLSYVDEDKMIELLKQTVNSLDSANPKITSLIWDALDTYYYELFSDEFQKIRVKLGYYEYDPDIRAYVET